MRTREGRDVLDDIDHGGPLAFPGEDGSVLASSEAILPRERRGCSQELTVPTPGASNHGARRIVVGQGGEPHWTADHDEHVERIRR